MKKVLIAFAVIIAMAAYGKKQAAAPETESSEVSNEVVTNDTISPEMKEANMQEVQWRPTASTCIRRFRDYRWPSVHHDGQSERRIQADGQERQVRNLRIEKVW